MTTTQTKFLSELKALLRKWQAEINVADAGRELNVDYNMIVTIASQYDENEICTREFREFSIGNWISYDSVEEIESKPSLFGDFDDGKLHPSV
jgi:hypothetical protein